MLDQGAKKLLQDHNRMIREWSAERLGTPPCDGCGTAVETWWEYCAMCGHKLDKHRKHR